MTREEFVKYYNCIAEHSKQSISIANALSQELLEGGCIIKYGDKLEDCCINLLSELSGIDRADIADLLYEGVVIGEEPETIVQTYINTPGVLYDFYHNK